MVGQALSAVDFAYVPDENGVAEGSFDLPQGGFTFTFFEPLGQGFRVELEAVDTGDCEWGDTDIKTRVASAPGRWISASWMARRSSSGRRCPWKW